MPQLRRLSRAGISFGIVIALVGPSTLQVLASAQTSSERLAALPRTPDEVVECDLLIVGGGLAGTAAAFKSLKAGHTVCLTEITDWLGGQISSQGTTALDESRRQRQLLFYAEGYRELRDRIEASSILEPVGSVLPALCQPMPMQFCWIC